MFELESKDYKKVLPLIKSQNELSVFSVINGNNPGEIYVNNTVNPTAALIQTSECNLIAGNPNDEEFNSQVSSELDFWDMLTPDSEEWMDKIPTIHVNPFVRKYIRRHYELSRNEFIECDSNLKEGYLLEKVNIPFLKENDFENSEKVLDWAQEWSNDEIFEKHGVGYLIRNDKTIVSWSLSDCYFEDKIAIGIHTDERYRKNGLGKIVASAVVKECFNKGYKKIHWLCVDTNKGSRAVAEKLGFKYTNPYYSFTSYAPIENIEDLSETEWHEWAEYLEEASKTQGCLIYDCLEAYIKANDVEKAMAIMMIIKGKKLKLNYLSFSKWVNHLQSSGLCSNFSKQCWIDFIDENINGNN